MKAIELINIITPEHARTSCSDENISNGFYRELDSLCISNEYHSRCSRCALLEIMNGESVDEKKLIETISIHFKI